MASRIAHSSPPGSLLKTSRQAKKRRVAPSGEAGQRRPRERNERHLAFIRCLPCASCLREPAGEAAHLRMGSLEYNKRSTGMGEKPDDKWSNPLCAKCHREGKDAQHRQGEAAFWSKLGIDPFALAEKLFSLTGKFNEARIAIIGFRTGILK